MREKPNKRYGKVCEVFLGLWMRRKPADQLYHGFFTAVGIDGSLDQMTDLVVGIFDIFCTSLNFLYC